MKPWLVTGCGRSGTAWAASMFTALGFGCGHEQQFNPLRHGPLVEPESSWLAVPYLDDLPPETPIIRVVRDPYTVVRSLMQRQFLDDDGNTLFDQFVQEHRPWITDADDKLTRAIRYATEWDKPVDETEHVVVRVDTGYAPEQMSGAVRLATGRWYNATRMGAVAHQVGRINASRHAPTEPTNSQIRCHPEGWRVQDRAQRWGYDDAPE